LVDFLPWGAFVAVGPARDPRRIHWRRNVLVRVIS